MKKTNTIKSKTRSILLMAVCVILFIALQIVVTIAGIRGTTQFNGVLMAFQFGICLLMLRVDYRIGFKISIFLTSFATIFLLSNILRSHNMSALPGFFNTIIYIISLTLLYWQFKTREAEAVTDVLTGLLNRRGLYKLLQKRTESKKPFHLIYIDLDNFKMINDNYGHSFGDFILKAVAKKLVTLVGTAGVITRMGGDEFTIILDGDQDGEMVANNIIKAIAEPLTIVVDESTTENYLRAYAGIASFPGDSRNYEELLKYADIAMFESAKNNSTTAYRFNKNMESAVKKQVELEMIIKESLEKNYFYLVYQPQFKLNSKELRGFEALLRIKTPTGNMISPADFIPVAEKTDLIKSIDEYVLKRALKELKEMTSLTDRPLTISVNVSAQSIASPEFANQVIKLVSESNIKNDQLEIEITEYCLVQSVDITIANIRMLKAHGIKVALDDFGTGYTSLAYLFKMPIDLLKIDKSLIDDIELNEKNKRFVNAVISLGHIMGCEVISEGVEKQEQLELLKEQNCDFIQGYVWGRPMEFDKAKEIL